MNPDPTRDDLQFLRAISEEGRHAPLLGGRFLTLWGALISVAYVGEYAILSGRFGLPPISMLILWVTVMGAGFLGQRLLVPTIRDKPGREAFANKVEKLIWVAVGMSIAAYAIGTAFATSMAGAPVILFDMILAVAFGGYGAAHYVMSRIARAPWMTYAALGSFLAAFVVPFLAGQPVLYLFAAVVVILVAVVPGVKLLMAEPPSLPEDA
ncbi:hypothetical protein [Parvularcula sp. LCG005]|uniref:hypothetical protein n=1 Tax=Parvularcula sp. LCG005 TaxID=3078805 RepID=UPI0029426DA5|nr:hypothetical protein [Parvularcula sp. LCG005]WOI53160.1 hypothetical protein RUI03_13515 [Parvularcula sp. LCG005]